MDIAIGGGIGGLALALALRQRGMPCRAHEGALGLGEAPARPGIENRERCFFHRFGQLIYPEPFGRTAGYSVPEVGMHLGRVHLTLGRAVVETLGAVRVLADHHPTATTRATSA